MKINDYIIRGGENLNSFPKKTPDFPADAEKIFNEWHPKLGQDDSEKENYFELPVKPLHRLFIRAFNIEKPGNRSICFYVGLLIPKTTYQEVKDYYRLQKGLCSISFDQINRAAASAFPPIEFSVDWPVPRTPIGLDFQQLSQMKLYGDENFVSHINQMCFSISINNIDDWFSRLFIAVNPYRLNPAFHIVISRKTPRQSLSNHGERQTIYVPAPSICRSTSADVAGNDTPSPPGEFPTKRPNNSGVGICFVFLFLLFVSAYLFVRCCNSIPYEKYKKELQCHDELKKRCEMLENEKRNWVQERMKMESEINKLRNENKSLSEQLKSFKGEKNRTSQLL